MKNRFVFCFGFLALSARAGIDLEGSYIAKMAGCYEVRYDFEETIPLVPDYELAPAFHSQVVEWIDLEEAAAEKIVLTHIASLPFGPMRHFSEEWDHEGKEFFEFKGNLTWTKRILNDSQRSGKWVQRVFHNNHAPRYASATVLRSKHNDFEWSSDALAPLPIRDTGRPYDVLFRGNRIVVGDQGWTHFQTNIKLKIESNEGLDSFTPVVYEDGKNIYQKIDDSRCTDLRRWWHERKHLWTMIRSVWQDIYNSRDMIQFNDAAASSSLSRLLPQMVEQELAKKTGNPDQFQSRVLGTIDAHLKTFSWRSGSDITGSRHDL